MKIKFLKKKCTWIKNKFYFRVFGWNNVEHIHLIFGFFGRELIIVLKNSMYNNKMPINIKYKEDINGYGHYTQLYVSHLSEDLRMRVAHKASQGHIFNELEIGQIITGTWKNYWDESIVWYDYYKDKERLNGSC